MKKFLSWKIIVILVAALLIGFFDAPNKVQETIFPFAPEWIKSAKIHLGLDLQGGSQLDYKVDLRKVPEKDRASIVDGVLVLCLVRQKILLAEPLRGLRLFSTREIFSFLG